MVTTTKRARRPALSEAGEQFFAEYEQRLRTEEDVAAAPIRNYLNDLRHFALWCESIWKQGRAAEPSFAPGTVTTPTLPDYRTYLQQKLHLKPNSVNRSLLRLKRYFAGFLSAGQMRYDPAKVVKLVGEEIAPPRHLKNQEEQALMAAVTEKGDVRDQAIIVLMLHTGLRARDVCTITRNRIRLGKRSGAIPVPGKRHKYREIPLNAPLVAYDASRLQLSHDPTPLFLSEKRHTQLTERGLGYLIKEYADRARVSDVSPHNLRHCFGYRMAQSVPLHRLAHLMGHDSPGTTMISVQGTKNDLQQAVETIA